MKSQTACFTGHRLLPKDKIPTIKSRLVEVVERLVDNGVIYYACGGAIGFDMLAGFTVMELKNKYPYVKLIAILPCKDQDARWEVEKKVQYQKLLDGADKVKFLAGRYYEACMLDRNRYMIEHSGHCIAYLTQNRGGAFFTVNLARRHGLAVYNLAE